MTREDGLWLAVILAAIGIAVLWMGLRVKSMQQHIDCLDKRTCDKVSEGVFRSEQEQRRSIERKVDAMQECLGLVTVEQQRKTLVVKKGNTS
jgi:hypothetical protein